MLGFLFILYNQIFGFRISFDKPARDSLRVVAISSVACADRSTGNSIRGAARWRSRGPREPLGQLVAASVLIAWTRVWGRSQLSPFLIRSR